MVGGGKRFFPDGVRLDLDLVEERAFASGLIYARWVSCRCMRASGLLPTLASPATLLVGRGSPRR
ncbi:hypothetical protein GCM10027436_35960 [Actinophytocola sediminis]